MAMSTPITPGSSAGQPSASCAMIADALLECLAALQRAIEPLPPGEYIRPAGDAFMGATVGGHVRHCLDHVAAIVDGWATRTLEYDRRARGTPVETDSRAAAAEGARLARGLRELRDHPVGAPLEVVLIVRPGEPAQRVGSTLGRELAFALSHTIHHQATIRGVMTLRGHELSGPFGLAPATIAHQGTAPCAR